MSDTTTRAAPMSGADAANAIKRLIELGRTDLAQDVASVEAERDRLRAALDYVIRDLEVRAGTSGVVELGHGAYLQAKRALEITP